MAVTINVIPDAEKFVGDHLRDHINIVDLDARVASRLPKSFTKPWVRITQLDAESRTGSATEYLINFFLQLDCYSGDENSQAEASLLARTVRSILHGMQGQIIDGIAVSEVVFTSHARIPDEAFEPWRERYVVDCEVLAHA